MKDGLTNEQLQELVYNFMNKGKQSPEDDYKDFLYQYMHAVNSGANDDDLNSMAGMVSPKRLGAMNDFAGASQTTNSGSPNIDDARNSLQGLLRRNIK